VHCNGALGEVNPVAALVISGPATQPQAATEVKLKFSLKF